MKLKILILLLLITSCKAGTINYYDANGVTKLFINYATPVTPVVPDPPPVYPPDTSYIGIPTPVWGDVNVLDLTYLMYDSETLRNASGLTYYASDSNGYYTHYIDANDPNVTANGVPSGFGTKAHPRATIPSSLPAGSIVEVHNAATWVSTYTVVNGTQDLPVFVRGVDDPNITNSTVFKAYYAILEGMYFNNKGVSVRAHNGIIPHHVCVRNNEFKGDGIWKAVACMGIYGQDSSNRVNNVVVYNNEISYFGQYDATSENDSHGVKIDKYASYIWILGNHIHHMGGDSVQVGPNGLSDADAESMGAHYIYVGGNVFHDNYEDGIDTKASKNVVYSQNVAYNLPNGGGMFLQTNYHAQSGWFLFNRVYNCFTGIDAKSMQHAYTIGNIVYDIEFIENYGAIGVSAPECGAIANIIYNCPRTIKIFGTPTTCTVENNIISEAVPNTGYSDYYLEDFTTVGERFDANDNLFYNSDGEEKIRWDNISYNTVAAWQSATGKGVGTVTSDPLFTNPNNGDFSFPEGSPIRSMNISPNVSTICNYFYDLYGIRIENYVNDFFTDGISYVPNEQ
jgi:hypothetical protein